MYTKFKLSNIQFGEIKIGDIEVVAKYTTLEVGNMYQIGRQAIKEVPEILEDLKAGVLKYMEIEEEVDNIIEEKMLEDIEARNNQELARQHAIAEIVKTRLNEVVSQLRKTNQDDMQN